MSDDITRLMLTDPLKLTDEDITAIINHMREKRHAYFAAPGAPKKAAPKLTDKQKAAAKLGVEIDL